VTRWVGPCSLSPASRSRSRNKRAVHSRLLSCAFLATARDWIGVIWVTHSRQEALAQPIGDMRKTDRQLVLGREHEVTSKFVMSWKPMRQRRLRQIKARTLRQHRSSLLGSVPKKNATAIGRPMRRRGVSAVDFIDHAWDQEPSLPQPARCRPIFPESAKAEWSARPSCDGVRLAGCFVPLNCPTRRSHSARITGAAERPTRLLLHGRSWPPRPWPASCRRRYRA
jgi:hypothetical protein